MTIQRSPPLKSAHFLCWIRILDLLKCQEDLFPTGKIFIVFDLWRLKVLLKGWTFVPKGLNFRSIILVKNKNLYWIVGGWQFREKYFFNSFLDNNSKTTEKFWILRWNTRCKILRPTILYLGKFFEKWTEKG